MQFLSDFISLFYPQLCLSCEQGLPSIKGIMCPTCDYHLDQTDMHLERENEFTDRFWGRVKIHTGAAMYRFVKGGRAQQLIHKLKYKGKRQIGRRLGQAYGVALSDSPYFDQIDGIVPVPLHPRKLQSRGYNQSLAWAKGLSMTMGVKVMDDILLKEIWTSTQTTKSRLERFDNVKASFRLKNSDRVKGKHILLVDDVLTTGATLEACAHQLLEIEGVKVSFATIAIGSL